jgi:anchored repeat-type ABC transporter ATP-binding subunit
MGVESRVNLKSNSAAAGLLEVVNLSVAYGRNLVLQDVSFCLQPGQLVGIIGPNGAGKSTLLKGILGIVPAGGKILIDGKPLRQARPRLSYVPQKEEVRWDFPVTVADVVMMGRYRRIGWVARPGKQDHAAVIEALDRVEMLHLKDRQISQLSGGQQQRVFMARALAQEGDIILLDEPLTGVDTTSQQVIMRLLEQLRDEGKLILMATHDLNTAAEKCDQLAFVNQTLIALGKPDEVFNPEILTRTYGGRAVNFGATSLVFD